MNTVKEYALELILKNLKSEEAKKPEHALLYIRLYRAIKNLIVQGNFPGNLSMPGTRTLAKKLCISRSTVIRAYEMLELEQLIEVSKGCHYKVKKRSNINPGATESNFYLPKLQHLISNRGHSYIKSLPYLS